MYKLKDIIQFNPQEKLRKGIMARKIAMEQLTPFNRFVQSNIFEEYKGGSKFRNGDTIMARITPCLENGKTAYISSLNQNELAFGSTEFIVLRHIEGITDSKYIYYLTISPQIREIAIKSMVGSSGRQRVQQSMLENYEILLPSLDKQREIATILSSLDDKIELNRRINDNLEQQAQTLFDHYFDSGSIYLEDSTTECLTDIAVYLNGLAMQKFPATDIERSLPVLKIKELGQHKCDNSSDRCSDSIDTDYIIDNGDIIFSWSGTLMVDVWCGGKCGLNQHLFKVTPLKNYPRWFVYYWTNRHLKKFKLIAKDKAVTMGHIRRSDLENAEVVIPKNLNMLEIDARINPLFQSIIDRRLEITKLENIRDTLLPKLMSGELTINEI